MPLSRELVRLLKDQFLLDWGGVHGGAHWARVRRNGLDLARRTGADPEVVELFAFFHDSRRENDGHDPDHGRRAAELARELNGAHFSLYPDRMLLLEQACRDHSEGKTRGDVTVLTCWDADRLDLGRIGIMPLADYLCTKEAREPKAIADAYRRSLDE